MYMYHGVFQVAFNWAGGGGKSPVPEEFTLDAAWQSCGETTTCDCRGLRLPRGEGHYTRPAVPSFQTLVSKFSVSSQEPRLSYEDLVELLQQVNESTVTADRGLLQCLSSMPLSWFVSLTKVLSAKYDHFYKEFQRRDKQVIYSVSTTANPGTIGYLLTDEVETNNSHQRELSVRIVLQGLSRCCEFIARWCLCPTLKRLYCFLRWTKKWRKL